MSPERTLPLTRAAVEAAVSQYWKVSTSKKAEEQQACYAENAMVFATTSKRLEPVRLVWLRRQREYLAGDAKMKVQLGNIDVEILDGDHAVAVYTIRLDAEEVAKPSADGQKRSEEHIQLARVTHIFQRGSQGALKIVHEHISVPNEM